MAISPKELIEMKMLSKVDGYVERIDDYLKTHEPMHEWFEATIQSEIPVVARHEIARRYIEAGWYKVYHHTTSENGERAGLSCFVFVTSDSVGIFERAHKNNLSTYWCVSEDGVYKSPVTIINK